MSSKCKKKNQIAETIIKKLYCIIIEHNDNLYCQNKTIEKT